MRIKRLLFALAVAATAGCTHHELARLTPLMSAASSGNATRVRELIASGADVNEARGLRLAPGMRIEGDTKPTHETALVFAVDSGDLDTIRALLDAGARTDVQTDSEDTVWRRLSRHLHEPKAAEILRMLLSHSQGIPPMQADSLLHDAMLQSNEAVVSMLLDRVDNKMIAYCYTALPLDGAPFLSMMALLEKRVGAPEGKALECGVRTDTPLKLEYFLKHGANPNQPGSPFRPLSSLAFEVMQGYPMNDERREMVRLLLRYGADPTLNDNTMNGNPIDMARKSGNAELLALLTQGATRR